MDSEAQPKDHPALRFLKFASIIVVLAVVFGGGFAFYDYVLQFSGRTRSQRERSAERVEKDTPLGTRGRLIFGAGVGAVLGAAYVGRCLLRKEEP